MPKDVSSSDWINGWLDSVVSGQSKMSQRKRSSIDAHGGLDALVSAATSRQVHLVQVTDDKGDLLIAASLHPFETLC